MFHAVHVNPWKFLLTVVSEDRMDKKNRNNLADAKKLPLICLKYGYPLYVFDAESTRWEVYVHREGSRDRSFFDLHESPSSDDGLSEIDKRTLGTSERRETLEVSERLFFGGNILWEKDR